MPNSYFITGIGTDVGKTLVAAIVTEALEADYWKPIQAGDLDKSDTHTVQKLVSNEQTQFHPNSYALNTPMSPHAAAEIDGIEIELNKINRPDTKGPLVIEGAGGLMVPINNENTILDLLEKKDKVILVSRHYLGSINHTLLSIDALRAKGVKEIYVIFNGDEYPTTEAAIKQLGKVKVIGRIDPEPYFDKMVVKEYADKFRKILCEI
jgi:dethiobiotin synthetase